MDRIINVKVGGNYISKDNKNAGVKGEANVTILRIAFDEGWDNYAKTITFWDALGGNPVDVTLTTDLLEDITQNTRVYLVPIPAEPMAEEGKLTFVIDGYIEGKKQRSFSDTLEVKYAPTTDNAGEPADPTPTQAEQLQSQIDGIIGTIADATQARKDAMELSKACKNHADNASQDAQDAQKYAEQAQQYTGKASYIGDDGYWYAWSMEQNGFYNTGVKAQAGSTVYCGDNPPDEADVWIYPNGEGKAFAEAIPTITKDEIDTLLPTGIYRYEEGDHLYLIIAKHTELSNYQTRIDTMLGHIQYRENLFLEGEWTNTFGWYDAIPDTAQTAYEATRAERDYTGRIIADTYATKAEVGDIETVLDELHNYAQSFKNGGGSV